MEERLGSRLAREQGIGERFKKGKILHDKRAMEHPNESDLA
jgi:hypothetical protein